MAGGYAEFFGTDQVYTTPMANFDSFLWTQLAASVSDPAVTLTDGGLVFAEGLFVVTANIVTEVTLPTDAADQLLRLEGNLTFTTGVGV